VVRLRKNIAVLVCCMLSDEVGEYLVGLWWLYGRGRWSKEEEELRTFACDYCDGWMA
jgi:hypothetical protein